jgi:hypothetical protein
MKEFQPELPKQETGILNNQDNLIKLSQKLEKVYENRPNPRDFVGSMQGTKYENEYTKDTIEKNEQYVQETRAKIEQRNSSKGQENLNHLEGGFQLSEILQAMVVDRMNKNWFKDCKAIMTSEFDDLRVGIDAVIKHEKGGYLGASFDFTVLNQDKKIYDKLDNHWKNNVIDGKIPTVKYFEDPDTKQKGKLLVPKFIIGASKRDVEELASAYINDNKEVLDNHPFKYLMLLQIEEQLQTVLDYYETIGDNESFKFAKTQYERIQTLLRSMKNEIHLDEKMHDIDLHEYSKKSIALDMMKRFRIMRDRKSK